MINGSADFAVILGGKNNVIENQTLNFSSSIPAPVNPGSHNFISGGEFNRIKQNANHAAIVGGRNNTIATGAINAIILGGSGITATQPNTAYMQNATVTDLALSGSGERVLMVDSSGNITASRNTNVTAWMTNGNNISNGDFFGSTSQIDLVIKTFNQERMRIDRNTGSVGINTTANALPTANVNNNYKLDILGNVRVLRGLGNTTDNIVFKTVNEPGPNGAPSGVLVPKIGIGTEDPVRALHVVTRHKETYLNTPNPNCPTCLQGPHNGLRVEDIFDPLFGSTVNTIWDIAPKQGMLVIGKGKANDPFFLDGQIVILNSNGFVGIGTASPKQKLDVDGRINVEYGVIQKGGSAITSTSDLGLYSLDPGNYMRFVTKAGAFRFSSDGNPNSITPSFSIESNGNVGIGVTNPPNRLDVNGTIRANEVKVCLFGTCDFVFDDNYDLMPIDSLNSYLKQNHHLPGIASAKQMEEEGDISLSKMNSQLLQKVEELTLYVIKLNNDIQSMKLENENFKAKTK